MGLISRKSTLWLMAPPAKNLPMAARNYQAEFSTSRQAL
jgi:hypothetical protein